MKKSLIPFLILLLGSVAMAKDIVLIDAKEDGSGISYREFTVKNQAESDLKTLFGEHLVRIYLSFEGGTQMNEDYQLRHSGVNFGFNCNDYSWSAIVHWKNAEELDKTCRLRSKGQIQTDAKTNHQYVLLETWDESHAEGEANPAFRSNRKQYEHMKKNLQQGLKGYSFHSDGEINDITSGEIIFESEAIKFSCHYVGNLQDTTKFTASCHGVLKL